MSVALAWLSTQEPERIGKPFRELGAAGYILSRFIAHPRGDHLLLGTTTGEVVVWDPATGVSNAVVKAHGTDISAIMVTTDEKIITASTDGFFHIYDTNFSLLDKIDVGSPIYSASLSPEGKLLAACCSDKVLRVYDFPQGTIKMAMGGHPDAITACEWLPGNVLVTGGAEGFLFVWEVDSKRAQRKHQPHKQHISSIKMSKQTNFYLTASWDGTIKVWNLQHRERFVFPTIDQPATSMTLSEDEKSLVTSYWDGSVRIWDFEKGRLFDEFPAHDAPLIGCTLVGNSQYLVSADQQGFLRSWAMADMGKTEYLNRHNGDVYDIACMPDNLSILTASYDGIVKVWTRNTRGESSTLQVQSGPITSCAVSPDGVLWALGTSSGEIKIWNVRDQSFEGSLLGHQETVSAIKFLPVGDKIVSCSWDMKVKLWSAETKTVLCSFDGHTKAVSGCDVSLDARIMASTSWDSTVRIWPAYPGRKEYGREIAILIGHTERVICCSISPDGMKIASGSADESIRIWSTQKTNDEPIYLHGHTGIVTACRYTPDGQILLSADSAGKINAWRTSDYANVAFIEHTQPIVSMAITPDGRHAIIGDEIGNVLFLDLQYPHGPIWLPTTLILQKPSLWNRGAPPTEKYQATCIYCGSKEEFFPDQLNQKWKCRKCSTHFMICPFPYPPMD